MMTINEAARKWGCTIRTIKGYICKGYILGLEIKEDEFLIPEIDRPYIRRNPKNQTSRSIDKRIKEALNHNGYVNYKILDLDSQRFIERMLELERIGSIRKNDASLNDYLSTQNFILCSKDSIPTVSLSFEVNITQNNKIQAAETIQIGGINTVLK